MGLLGGMTVKVGCLNIIQTNTLQMVFDSSLLIHILLLHPLQVAGYVVEYSSGLSYATAKGGGHMVPSTNPREALDMFSRFVAGKSLTDDDDTTEQPPAAAATDSTATRSGQAGAGQGSIATA